MYDMNDMKINNQCRYALENKKYAIVLLLNP
jgi:hypothetical protein